jgi:L-arabinonolactonase
MLRIEPIADVHAEFGEGPLWDVAEQRLYWIGSLGARVHSCDAGGVSPRTWSVPEHTGALALRRSGGAVVSLRDGFYALSFETGDCRKLVDPDPGKPRIRMNDGKVDRQGRFVAAYMDYEERDPICALFRLEPAGNFEKLDDGIVCSNSPCWSPEGRTFYFADTWTGEIWAYDYDLDTGDVSNKRTFCKVDRSRDGAADGATVDAEGCVWSALVYDGRLVRYSPDGKVDRTIEMPVKKVTSVMFGGPNLDVLNVTAMAKPPLPRFPGDGQMRGSLFAIYDLGMRGVPEPRFAG